MNKNFALIGAGGYIAPRHIEAIKNTNNKLIAALDPNDSVGILDKHFFDVEYFQTEEEFIKYFEREDTPQLDFISICSPNFLHEKHIELGLRLGAQIICEKPITIDIPSFEKLEILEKKSNNQIFTVLQLRHHPAILELKKKVDSSPAEKIFNVELNYITSRGPWYHKSWKGELTKSGGLATNIGVHFFDMLTWIFGDIEESELHISNDNIVAGYLRLTRARIKWILSIDRKYLPQHCKDEQKTTFRSITVDRDEIEFSKGFTGLHDKVYCEILNGNGYTLEAAKRSIKIIHDLRNSKIIEMTKNSHPYLLSIKESN